MPLRRSHRRLCTVFGIPSVLHNLHLYLILICASLPHVIGVGVFEVKLREIWNPGHRDMNQKCCSGTELKGVCSSPCRTFFYTCLRQYPRPAHPSDCTYGHNTSRVYNDSSFILTSNNVARFPFTPNWPGSFSLKVTAKVAGSSNTIIEALINTPSYGASLEWSNFTQDVNTTNGFKIKLNLSYRFICAPNNFGANCSKACTPRNDQFGHFTCDANGNIVCLPGWGGHPSDKYCENPICNPDCGKNGRCVGPNTCSCSQGWRGPTCSECEVYPGCVHGTCKSEWQCNCMSGWGGLYCDLELDYCGRNKPCKHGDCRNIAPGRYKCLCNKGYGGVKCDSELNECASNPCKNRGTCTDKFGDFTCSCPAGFQGKQCEINIDDCKMNSCKNGGTCVDGVRSYSCRCPAGFSGKACEVVLPRTTRQPLITQNPGTNTTGNSGNTTIIGGQRKGESSAGWSDLKVVILPVIFGFLIIICLIVGCVLWRIYRKRQPCCCYCCLPTTSSRDPEEPNTRTDRMKQVDPSDINGSSDTDLKQCRVGNTSKTKNNITPDIIINFVPSRSNQKNVNSDKASRISKERQLECKASTSTEDTRFVKPLNRTQETVT
ncbi:delta-like protein 1 isoform X2 [Actinia tenebrosa]|uniref:Delta-like protein n=1 Tax=Actinia tenebrosa TaxID=6105 RepID=A0A6P8IAS5_ACTTE|nr:delta-like protein 1 isoform X2 [Actinia tenebrosa]